MNHNKHIIISCILCLCLCLLSLSGCSPLKINILPKQSTKSEDETAEPYSDEAILQVMLDNNLIASDDTFLCISRNIGIVGIQGPSRYLYQTQSGNYYYTSFYYDRSQSSDSEIVYKATIEECDYNDDEDAIDRLIVLDQAIHTDYEMKKTTSGWIIEQIVP